jgi:hypothetical protein
MKTLSLLLFVAYIKWRARYDVIYVCIRVVLKLFLVHERETNIRVLEIS